MIPLKYNVRNLRVRWKTTMMTVLGTGLVVWSSCILFGLVEGMEHSLAISGDPLDVIVMRKGSSTETTGGFESSKADELLNLPGIARDERGRPLAAKELLNIPIAERENGTRTNIIVRGVQPASRQLRPNFRIVEGSDLVEGRGECIVSRQMSKRFKGAQIGGRLEFGDKEKYTVVGIFTAGGSAAESEVWADLKDVERNTGREGSVSCVQVRAASSGDYDKLRDTIENDTRFKLAAIPESVYFLNQSR
ncbi:MAG TPA: ABC transporter permease, partial [Isosphaeraceae bacterium]|nr:ABC transporter permease [Isosphaeraceae bacterium]